MPSLQGVAGHPHGDRPAAVKKTNTPFPHLHPCPGPHCSPGHLGNRFPKHACHQVTPGSEKGHPWLLGHIPRPVRLPHPTPTHMHTHSLCGMHKGTAGKGSEQDALDALRRF